MKKLLWFFIGITVGAIATKQIEENPAAKKAYEDAKLSVAEFRDAVMEGYKEREAELNKPKPKRTSSASRPKNKPASK
ncbi:MAG: hypothetical protein ACKOXT_02275 [Actinomycetota bacterium]